MSAHHRLIAANTTVSAPSPKIRGIAQLSSIIKVLTLSYLLSSPFAARSAGCSSACSCPCASSGRRRQAGASRCRRSRRRPGAAWPTRRYCAVQRPSEPRAARWSGGRRAGCLRLRSGAKIPSPCFPSFQLPLPILKEGLMNGQVRSGASTLLVQVGAGREMASP